MRPWQKKMVAKRMMRMSRTVNSLLLMFLVRDRARSVLLRGQLDGNFLGIACAQALCWGILTDCEKGHQKGPRNEALQYLRPDLPALDPREAE